MEMESKNKNKKGGASMDELFARKENKNSSSSSVSGYFFPPASSTLGAIGKETTQGDLYSGFNKQRAEAHNGHRYAFDSDGKSQQESPTKKQNNYNKEGKHFSSANESVDSLYFGSSVHYGGRDFYGSSPTKPTVETSRSYKDDHQDGSVATRGDWWQDA